MEVLNRKPMNENEDTPALESAADEATQKRAEAMGWIPPTRFKGDVTRYVDAEEYVRRAEEVLPIVKKNLERTESELSAMRVASAAQTKMIGELKELVQANEERHTVATQKAVEQARKDLKVQLEAASREGDHAAVAELTEQMTEMSAAEVKTTATTIVEKKEEVAQVDPRIKAEVDAWNAENAWFGTDEEKTALALGHAQKLRKAGDKSLGREFFDKISVRVAEVFEPKSEQRINKVESGRNGGEGEGRSGTKSGYSQMPKEARDACDADARRFVGAGKRYKTKAEWQESYAKLYHAMP